MTRTDPTRVLRTAGVALLPAVVLLCCAGRADAECGGYVRIIGPDGKVQAPADHDPMPGERPCRGPECTGGPKAPAPVPPAPVSPNADGKALVIPAAGPPEFPSANRVPSDAGELPVRRSNSIFHPPRVG